MNINKKRENYMTLPCPPKQESEGHFTSPSMTFIFQKFIPLKESSVNKKTHTYYKGTLRAPIRQEETQCFYTTAQSIQLLAQTQSRYLKDSLYKMFSLFAFLVWKILQRNAYKPSRLSHQGKQLFYFKKEIKNHDCVDGRAEME